MATVINNQNAQKVAQVATLAVTAVAVAGTLSATINLKSITYVCITGDTTATAAAAWLALLQASTAPTEFAEITWSLSGSTITGTAATPGNPFTLTKSQAGGATCTLTAVTANVSPSDVNNANNWLRSGSPAIPQNGDTVILQDSNIPFLWNVDALAAVQFASFTRWQSFSAQVGLPDQNPNGYIEYRPTKFKFVGAVAGTAIPVTLGVGSGSRTALERYDVGAQRVNLTVLAAGQVDFYGTQASNTFSLVSGTLRIAPRVTDTSSCASGTVDGGGSLTLGPNVVFSGTLTVSQGQATVRCAPTLISASNGARITCGGSALTYPAVTAILNSVVTWLSDSTITALTLRTGSIFDKSQDIRAMTISTSAMDGDTCRVLDPMSAITWSTGTIVSNQVTAGPITFLGPRTLKVT